MTERNTEDAATWHGVKRRDGVVVLQGVDGNWLVFPNDEGPAIDRCPHCGELLEDIEQAQLVADHVWPLSSSA
jgi:hypothetical protein